MFALGAAETVGERMEPTLFDLRAYNYAVSAFNEYEHYGFPYPGTIRDQPMIWRLAVDCVREGHGAGRAQASSEEAKARKEEYDTTS